MQVRLPDLSALGLHILVSNGGKNYVTDNERKENERRNFIRELSNNKSVTTLHHSDGSLIRDEHGYLIFHDFYKNESYSREGGIYSGKKLYQKIDEVYIEKAKANLKDFYREVVVTPDGTVIG